MDYQDQIHAQLLSSYEVSRLLKGIRLQASIKMQVSPSKFLYTKLLGPSHGNVDISVNFSRWDKSSDDVTTKVMMANPIELSSVIKLNLFYL